MQILYLEHSVDSLARGGPWQLGKIVQGKSGWRPLREVETEEYGGSSRRVLYGCVVTLLSDGSSSMPGSSMLAMVDEHQSLLLHKDVTKFQAHGGSFKADKGWQSGSRGSFNIASTMPSSTFKQLLFTWSRVYTSTFFVFPKCN